MSLLLSQILLAISLGSGMFMEACSPALDLSEAVRTLDDLIQKLPPQELITDGPMLRGGLEFCYRPGPCV